MPLATRLAALEASGLIRLAQVQPEIEYLFRHTLVQDAAYASLLKADRRILHRLVGEVLERLYPDRLDVLAFVLGQHFREAGEVDRARQYFIRAGHIARQHYANQEAITAYAEALALTADDAQRFDLLAARAAVYDVIAARDGQRADVDNMLALTEKLNDDALHCDALIALADYYLATEHIRAREPAERAAEVARALADPLREGRALQRLGVEARSRFDNSDSRRQLEIAAARLRQAGQPGETAACLGLLGLVLVDTRDFSTAQVVIEEAVRLSQMAGDRRQEAISLRRLAINALEQGRYVEALPHAEVALALHRQLGDRAEECHALNVLGSAHQGLDQWEAAESCFGQSLQAAWAIGLGVGIWYAINNLMELYLRMGDQETALAFVDRQLARAQSVGDALLVRHAQVWGRVRLLLQFGQQEQALELALAMLPVTEGLMGLGAQAVDMCHIGRIQAELGRFALARQTLARAVERAEGANDPIAVVASFHTSAYIAWLEGGAIRLHAGLEDANRAMMLAESANHKVGLTYNLILKARILLALGANADAPSCTREALHLLGTTKDIYDVEGIFFIHSRALRTNGQDSEADEYLQKAYDRVMLVARKTKDDTLRRSWLDNVRDNREIVAEWESRKR